jgi:hypothetical protein
MDRGESCQSLKGPELVQGMGVTKYRTCCTCAGCRVNRSNAIAQRVVGAKLQIIGPGKIGTWR